MPPSMKRKARAGQPRNEPPSPHAGSRSIDNIVTGQIRIGRGQKADSEKNRWFDPRLRWVKSRRDVLGIGCLYHPRKQPSPVIIHRLDRT
jgi:hypothetical protein